MKINDIVTESTTAGSIATVAAPMTAQSRNASIYGGKKGGNLLTGKKTNKKYANSISEGKMKELATDMRNMDNGNFKKKYGKSKEQLKFTLGDPNNKPLTNESVPLKFHTIKLTKENITGYSISVFEAYNINKHNQTYKSLLYGMLNNRRSLVESMEKSNIDHLTNTIDRLNSKKEIKIGDMFSVLLFIINPIHEHVEVLGFTKPKEVKEIKRRNDGTIDFIRFTDMDRYPRAPIAAVGKHHAQHPAYFSSEQEADNALLMLKLTLPETWEIDLDSVNDPNYRSGLAEKNMKISEINEAHLEEDDVIIVPGQGHRLKSGFIPHGESRLDHEVEMARSDLFSAAKNAKQVYEIIADLSEEEGLEGWIQEKIIKANDYLNTIREYLEGKQVQEMTGGVIAAGGVGEGIVDKIKGAVRREKAKDLPLVQTRRDYAMGKAGDAYNKGEIRKGNQYSAYAEKDRKKKGDPTTNPDGTYRTKTSDYTNEASGQKYEMRFANGKTQRFTAATPEEAKKKSKGLGATSLIKVSKDGAPQGKVTEAQSMSGALKNTLAKAEPGSKLDNSIKAHNRDIKNGGKGTLKNAPTGYHFDKKGYCRLGDK